ncbi:unnamed protein product [marine sediment metagenome]|uniref:Uncharacterized protein n=1 Tax=marine sediment metagenome TaxID=412755 RepID=X0UP15_9ZZZZ
MSTVGERNSYWDGNLSKKKPLVKRPLPPGKSTHDSEYGKVHVSAHYVD